MRKFFLKIYWKLPLFFQQMIKFGIVGVINTFITLSIIFILMKGFNTPYIYSNIIGYFFGLLNSFILNKNWTFKSNGKVSREAILFLILFGVSYLLQLGVLVFIVEVLTIREDLSQIFAIGVYTLTNFLGNKLITFR